MFVCITECELSIYVCGSWTTPWQTFRFHSICSDTLSTLSMESLLWLLAFCFPLRCQNIETCSFIHHFDRPTIVLVIFVVACIKYGHFMWPTTATKSYVDRRWHTEGNGSDMMTDMEALSHNNPYIISHFPQ